MNEFMRDYLTACIESAAEVRMAVTTDTKQVIKEDMLTCKQYEALQSIGRNDLIQACLQYPAEAFLNVTGTAPVLNCKAFNKLVDTSIAQLGILKNAYTEALISMRLAHMFYMLKCSMLGQIIAVDMLDINQMGYNTVIDAVDTDVLSKIKNKIVCIPLLHSAVYTGTKCIVKYIAECKTYMISIEHDDYMYASATLYIHEENTRQFTISYSNALKDDGSTMKARQVTCDAEPLHKNIQVYAEMYAAVLLAILQIDTVNTVYSSKARTKKQSKAGDSTDKLVPVAKTKYIYAYKSNAGHGTHCSPREHIRKGHYRHYKSGKVVFIAESIINKGHNKTLYKATNI